ncbi:uncharacterized protein EV420DRAFT_971594 [Desarmillaria tabescens]|uniref:Uncharacterized protein n=1 Tax=Armillaria tabescens TaxID=1929756 RepID=A0AA39MTC5_ARMTA|nr:uncharacterized protein EV420DRAFT_971594 [Desarmillaria tabescens]KAK0445309.1 hypothetical protein EV420DRAFT_971594 [Desarmillaria tabescens]
MRPPETDDGSMPRRGGEGEWVLCTQRLPSARGWAQLAAWRMEDRPHISELSDSGQCRSPGMRASFLLGPLGAVLSLCLQGRSSSDALLDLRLPVALLTLMDLCLRYSRVGWVIEKSSRSMIKVSASNGTIIYPFHPSASTLHRFHLPCELVLPPPSPRTGPASSRLRQERILVADSGRGLTFVQLCFSACE